MRHKFYENVAYLEQTIPPDDIYLFTEQTFMAALFFLKKWSECADLNEVCKHDEVAKKWITNIIGFQRLKDAKMEANINLDLESVEE